MYNWSRIFKYEESIEFSEAEKLAILGQLKKAW
jgi:hypothetical protein